MPMQDPIFGPVTVSVDEFASLFARAFATASCALPGAVTCDGHLITVRTPYGQVFEAYVAQVAGPIDIPLDSAQVAQLDSQQGG